MYHPTRSGGDTRVTLFSSSNSKYKASEPGLSVPGNLALDGLIPSLQISQAGRQDDEGSAIFMPH